MLGKNRFVFETPNAIDAGEAPPTRPGRRSGGDNPLSDSSSSSTRTPRSVLNVQASSPKAFRGTKIHIVDQSKPASATLDDDQDDHNNDRDNLTSSKRSRSGRTSRSSTSTNSAGGHGHSYHDEENPVRRFSASTNSSLDEDDVEAADLDIYEGDEPVDDQLPSADEARIYAASVLSESFRRLQEDSPSEDLDFKEAKPLTTTRKSWSRPSRRQAKSSSATFSHNYRRNANDDDSEFLAKWKRHGKYICLGGLLLVGIALVIGFAVGPGNNHGKPHRQNNNNNQLQFETFAPAVMGSSVDIQPDARLQATIDWLGNAGISDSSALASTDTPQGRAAEWIADEDPLQRPIPTAMDENGQRFVQRYVLAVVYFSLWGERWHRSLNFLSNTDECSWFESETASGGQQFAIGVSCRPTDLLVKDIFIPKNDLHGSIPSELQHLQTLEFVSFRHNNISGDIPAAIAKLNGLQYLDLSRNDFSGKIAGEILSRLTSLKVLGLGGNHFHSTLPSELAALTNLVTLEVEDNLLTGPVSPVLNNMKALKYLYAGTNEFLETVDESFLANTLQLREVTLDHNLLSTPKEKGFPALLLEHQRLQLLDLSDNNLQGSLPDSIKTNRVLKFLNLKSNDLSGMIPWNIESLTGLEYLDVSQNELVGEIPPSLGNIKSLQLLYMGDNTFDSQAIPGTLFTLTNLRELSLRNSQLTGYIHPWLHTLRHLQYLDLASNALSGTLSDVWDMPNLSVLLLNDNKKLTGTIPQSFAVESHAMKILSFENTGISGSAVGLCDTAKSLTTFSYECAQVTCPTDCCRTTCCDGGDDAKVPAQCFSDEVSMALEERLRSGSNVFFFNRTTYSFSPNIILANPTQ